MKWKKDMVDLWLLDIGFSAAYYRSFSVQAEHPHAGNLLDTQDWFPVSW